MKIIRHLFFGQVLRAKSRQAALCFVFPFSFHNVHNLIVLVYNGHGICISGTDEERDFA